MEKIPPFPPIDQARVRRALRAAIGEDARVADDQDGLWLVLSPGLNPLKLALAVVSAEVREYLKALPLSEAELCTIERVLARPEEQALKEIGEGRWDPPYE